MGKIAEDEDEYHDLCKHFGEPSGAGPYSEHCKLLKRLYRKEQELHKEHLAFLQCRDAGLKKLSDAEKKALGLRP